MAEKSPGEITLSFYWKNRITVIDVATAKEIDELDPGDPGACSDFVELVKESLSTLREEAEKSEG